jgi:hypothetical protein
LGQYHLLLDVLLSGAFYFACGVLNSKKMSINQQHVGQAGVQEEGCSVQAQGLNVMETTILHLFFLPQQALT